MSFVRHNQKMLARHQARLKEIEAWPRGYPDTELEHSVLTGRCERILRLIKEEEDGVSWQVRSSTVGGAVGAGRKGVHR